MEFRESLWPVGLPYFSSVRALYLSRVAEPIVDQEIIARDGIASLLWFFRNHPAPTARSPFVFVHETAAFCVPEAWESRAGTYRLATFGHEAEAILPPDEILFFAFVHELQTSIGGLRQSLQAVQGELNFRGWEPNKKSAYVHHGPARATSEEFRVAFILELAHLAGAGLQAYGWGDIKTRDSFSGTLIVDVSDGLLSLDNYLVHHALARGARLFESAPGRKGAHGERIALSPHHGWILHRDLVGAETSRRQFAELARDLRAVELFYSGLTGVRHDPDDEQVFPWPRWFDGWVNEWRAQKI